MDKTMRQSKLTPELTEDLCDYISQGLTFKDACQLLDISTKSQQRWEKKGREAKSGKYYDFYLALKKARKQNKLYHIKKINASKDWHSSAYILNNMYPDEFSNNNKLSLDGGLGLKHDVSSFFDEGKMKQILEQEEEDKVNGDSKGTTVEASAGTEGTAD